MGPGAAFPPFAAPEFHPTTPENWKGATIHPPGLMKEPAVVPGRNAAVAAFTAQGQTQVTTTTKKLLKSVKNNINFFHFICNFVLFF